MSGAIDEPEYKNVDYNPHEDDPANYAQYPTPKSAYENQRIVSDLMALNLAGMVGEYDPEGDYINQDPEGQFHTYSNHSELLEQVSVCVCVCVCSFQLRIHAAAPKPLIKTTDNHAF